MTARRAAVGLCCGALALLPGCGSSNKGKPIPATTAGRLIALIQKADSQSAAGTCGGAAAKVVEAEGVASSIPSSVDSKVRQNISDGLARLKSLVQQQCQKPQQTQTDTTPTDTTPTETTQTQTLTQTTPTETTPTQTQPTDTNTVPTGTTPTGTGTGTTTTTGNGGTPTSTGATGGTGGTG